MTDLVTAAEARDHLRIDDGVDSAWLTRWIPVASAAVIGWLKDEWRVYEPELDVDGEPVLDSSGDPIPAIDTSGNMMPRDEVVGAVLMELASLYRFRDGSGKDNVVPADAGHGYTLNKSSTALLQHLRKSTVR